MLSGVGPVSQGHCVVGASSLQVALLGGAGRGVSWARPTRSGTGLHGALHRTGAGTCVCAVCVCCVLVAARI